MPRSLAAALSALLLAAAPATAKDVCVMETGPPNVLVFKKVKKLKKPGTAIPLQGFYVIDGEACALSGAAVVLADGSVSFGATAHCQTTLGGNDVHFGAEGAADFDAQTAVDRDGDGVVDSSDAWTPIDCESVVLP